MAAMIPAQNVVRQAKNRTYPSMDPARQRIRSFATKYRHGLIGAEAIPPSEREAVMVYLLEHPRDRRKDAA